MSVVYMELPLRFLAAACRGVIGCKMICDDFGQALTRQVPG
jgi:hypothetical protein